MRNTAQRRVGRQQMTSLVAVDSLGSLVLVVLGSICGSKTMSAVARAYALSVDVLASRQ